MTRAIIVQSRPYHRPSLDKYFLLHIVCKNLGDELSGSLLGACPKIGNITTNVDMHS
jgi:hypothetical protein